MDNNEQLTEQKKEFKFKMDKTERYISVAIFLVFFMSFTRNDSAFWMVLFFALTVVIFAYYFKWYRKKPSYVLISDDEIVIHPPLFFKPNHIRKDEVKRVSVDDKKIEIEYDCAGTSRKIGIYSLIIDENDRKLLAGILKQLNPKKK